MTRPMEPQLFKIVERAVRLAKADGVFCDGIFDDREKRILLGYYIDRLTLQQLGDELGITRERVRQLRSRAEKKLYKWDEKKGQQ